jgi:hypothetical protein
MIQTMTLSQGFRDLNRQIELVKGYEEIGRMLGGMIAHPERFK